MSVEFIAAANEIPNVLRDVTYADRPQARAEGGMTTDAPPGDGA